MEYRKNTWGVKEMIERQTAGETQENLESALEYLAGLASEGFPGEEQPPAYEPYLRFRAPGAPRSSSTGAATVSGSVEEASTEADQGAMATAGVPLQPPGPEAAPCKSHEPPASPPVSPPEVRPSVAEPQMEPMATSTSKGCAETGSLPRCGRLTVGIAGQGDWAAGLEVVLTLLGPGASPGHCDAMTSSHRHGVVKHLALQGLTASGEVQHRGSIRMGPCIE